VPQVIGSEPFHLSRLTDRRRPFWATCGSDTVFTIRYDFSGGSCLHRVSRRLL